jgi:dGTPase
METRASREQEGLAGYAMRSRDSAGRHYPEALDPIRDPYEVDRARLIHSAAFRRLSHKTQVFTGERSDYHRTRLTHSLEVAVVARTLGRSLRLNEDLIEALALAHDLGHPPFGHAGEAVLDKCLAGEGGFNHNRQALRIVEKLERYDPRFVGLNLSAEVLQGQGERAPTAVPRSSPLLEVQVVEAADSVTYDTHDADDALYLGLLELDELLEIPLWRAASRRVRLRYADLASDELRWAVLQELLDWQLTDLVARATAEIAAQQIECIADVLRSPTVVSASPDLIELKAELEDFLFQRVYQHPQVLEVRATAQDALGQLFAHIQAQPELLPSRFASRVPEDGLARTVGDYLAGMTDRFALSQYRAIHGDR